MAPSTHLSASSSSSFSTSTDATPSSPRHARLGSGTEDASSRNKNGNGYIPRQGASQFGRLEVVLVFLEHGAHANDRARIAELHWTPLHRASLGCLEVARVLLEHGADPDSRDRDGRTLLKMASRGHLDYAQVLYCDVDLNPRYSYNQSLLRRALRTTYLKVGQVLLDHGANANAQGNYSQTALHLASQDGHLGFACVLPERGADAIHVTRITRIHCTWHQKEGITM